MRSLVQVQDGPYLYVGGIAQLVERLLCKQDVSGSSPLTSTEYHLLHVLKREIVLSRVLICSERI